jgi:hypothetical protein
MKTGRFLVRDTLAGLARFGLLSFALTALLGSHSIQAYERLQGPTELLFCNRERNVF